MKAEVLKFLKEKDEYVSGEEISRRLGVTRACIWKAIKKLQAEGYVIESSTKKGYKLKQVSNIINKVEIEENITTHYLGGDVRYYDEIGSTNEEAKRLARQGEKEGTVVVADRQIQGKGRRGRNWSSPSGVGIWMSLILRPDILPHKASQVTLVAGLSMCKAISKVTGMQAAIKWPNDIVVNHKKVCGILTEMSAEVDAINYIVVGIGVNVNNDDFDEELPYATSLKREGGREYERKEIIKVFLEEFEKDYGVYKEEGDFTPLCEEYSRYCITLNNKVKIISNKSEEAGTAVGITSDGELEVMNDEGEKKVVFAGEVSVRGLYGYI